MKQILILLSLILITTFCIAQNSNNDNKVYVNAEIEAKFPGGDTAWIKYLQQNLKPNTPIINGAPKGNYQVIIRFIVSRNGSVDNVGAETKYGFGMEAEAIRIIANGPSWIPGIHNGNKVNSFRRQPITFVVE